MEELPFDKLKEMIFKVNLKSKIDAANLQYTLNTQKGVIEAKINVTNGKVIYNPKKIKKAKIQKMAKAKSIEENDIEYSEIVKKASGL